MLPQIVVDPSLLWMISGEDIKFGIIEEVVSRAAEWRSLLSTPCAQIFVSAKAIDRLIDLDMFPGEQYLYKVLEAADLLEVLNPRQIATSIARFLSTVSHIEDSWPISDALLSSGVICEILNDVPVDELREVSSTCLALVAANILAEPVRDPMTCIAVPRSSKTKTENVEFDISVVEPDKYADIIGIQHIDIKFCARPSDIICLFSPFVIWCHADDAREIGYAIYLRALELATLAQTTLCTFSVGTSFVESLKGIQAYGKSKFSRLVLEKCAQVLSQSPLLDVGYLHESEKSSKIVRRSRDEALARRLHVNKGNEALRLMYWEGVDGCIEFSCVRNKSDTVIYDGNRAEILSFS